MPGGSIHKILISVQAGYKGGKTGKELLGIEPRSLAWAASALTSDLRLPSPTISLSILPYVYCTGSTCTIILVFRTWQMTDACVMIGGLSGTRLQHGSTTCAVYIREDWEACSWLGSCSSVVRALTAQASDLGLNPSNSCLFSSLMTILNIIHFCQYTKWKHELYIPTVQSLLVGSVGNLYIDNLALSL